jgi:HSP20 family protein
MTKWHPFGTRENLERLAPGRRGDPFWEMERDLARLWNRMDQMFGQPLLAAQGEGVTETAWWPRVDITEDEKEYLVKAELPGVKKEEIKVTVRDGNLTLSGERKAEKEEKGRRYHRLERTYGSFERSFTLPGNAEAANITSEFKEGVLSVHLPKVPGATARAIEVKVS